jgi:putative Holliday junction resolvase
MRYLGIDYGSKRIGIALSDPIGRMAFPFSVVLNTTEAKENIKKIVRDNNVGAIVAGDSKDRNGLPNIIMTEARPFCDSLAAELELPIHYRLEAYTSVQAAKIQGDNAMNDASAAAIILQSYLDGINVPLEGVDDVEME